MAVQAGAEVVEVDCVDVVPDVLVMPDVLVVCVVSLVVSWVPR